MPFELFEFQKPWLPLILDQLDRHGFSLNASDTGTGKTFLTLAVIQERQLPVLVTAPRGLQSMWREVLAEHCPHVPVLDVTSIDKLRYGNHPFVTKSPPRLPGAKPTFQWTLPVEKALIVVEEVHTCSGADSQAAALLAKLKATPHEVVALSATAADSPAKLRALGYFMGLHNFRDFQTWALQNGCFIDEYGKIRYAPHVLNKELLTRLHRSMFPEFGVRMRIADIPDFPENQIVSTLIDTELTPAMEAELREKYPQVYDLDDPECVSLVEQLSEAVKKEPPVIVQFLRQRQQAEFRKIPFFIEHIHDLLDEGISVAVFCNFIATIQETRKHLGVPSEQIIGPMSTRERDAARDRFQRNETHVLFATPGAGGVGISLHDLHGRPRVSLISPGFSTVAIQQTLGRIHRAGALTPARQHFVCVKGTAEEMVQRVLHRKRNQLSLLQDGELLPDLH